MIRSSHSPAGERSSHAATASVLATLAGAGVLACVLLALMSGGATSGMALLVRVVLVLALAALLGLVGWRLRARRSARRAVEQCSDGPPADPAHGLDPRSQVELEAFLACLPMFTIVAAPDGTIVHTNRVELDAHAERPGGKLWDFVSSDQRSRIRRACRRCVELMKPVEVEIEHQRDDGTVQYSLCRVAALRAGDEIRGLLMFKRDISAAHEADQHRRRLASAVEQASDSIVITDPAGSIVYVNPAFERISGYSAAEALGANPSILKSGHQGPEVYQRLWRTITDGRAWTGRLQNRARSGELFVEQATITPILDDGGRIEYFLAVKRDITEQLALETKLAHAQKMESVGQLAAGIAHEINTPTQYVSDNTQFLQRAFGKLLQAVEVCVRHAERRDAGAYPDGSADALRRELRACKLDFLRKQVPAAIEQSLEGLRRVAKIVSAMRDFSHPSGGQKELVDLGQLIETAVTVSRNEWKYVAEVQTEVAAELPPVPCVRDELSQVLLNMIVNAAQAIAESHGDETDRGIIHIEASASNGVACIRIRDTGIGIDPDTQRRIFDPFFTTKGIGKGTGQGLAIAHSVVVDKHGGTIEVESEPGLGAMFTITLPLERAPVTAEPRTRVPAA